MMNDFTISADERLALYEDAVVNVTEELLVRMEDLELSKAELARLVGKSRSSITKMLDGDRNMTLRSLVTLATALGLRPEVVFHSLDIGERENAISQQGSSRGTENVLIDLGFDDAEELSAKALLAVKLNELIEQRGLNQTEVVGITGMPQPKVSQVCRNKLQTLSLERLMQALVSLDQEVEIVVRPARRAHGAGITVSV
jgi:predicted XRE-type DNA-binding protein